MVGCLLDTHVVIWMLDDSPRLGADTRQWLMSGGPVYVSSATMWEVAIKAELGKLAVPDDFPDLAEASGLKALPIGVDDSWATRTIQGLPHRDPFDRLLIAQAVRHGLVFVTADQVLLDAAIEPHLPMRDARD